MFSAITAYFYLKSIKWPFSSYANKPKPAAAILPEWALQCIYNVSTIYNVDVHNPGAEHRAVACADLSFADDLSHRRKPNALSQHRDVINIEATQSIQ